MTIISKCDKILLTEEDIMKEQIEEIRRDIKDLAAGEVTIVAASKMQPVEKMNELLQYGVNTVGENKVQELLAKYTPDTKLEWQFIGTLQTNKVKYIADKVSLIQSLDKISLVKEIQKQCQRIGKIMPVLIEVNIGREEQKSGILEEELPDFIAEIKKYSNIKISGLMTVMPIGASDELFRRMNELFLKCKRDYPDIGWKWLSMGMSADYKIALKNGANMIRIGEKIFGKRKYS